MTRLRTALMFAFAIAQCGVTGVWGCGGEVTVLQGTETGNPPAIAKRALSLRRVGDELRLFGAPGAITPGGAVVEITNVETGESSIGTASVDGSVDLPVPGEERDNYIVVVRSGGQEASIRIIADSDEFSQDSIREPADIEALKLGTASRCMKYPPSTSLPVETLSGLYWSDRSGDANNLKLNVDRTWQYSIDGCDYVEGASGRYVVDGDAVVLLPGPGACRFRWFSSESTACARLRVGVVLNKLTLVLTEEDSDNGSSWYAEQGLCLDSCTAVDDVMEPETLLCDDPRFPDVADPPQAGQAGYCDPEQLPTVQWVSRGIELEVPGPPGDWARLRLPLNTALRGVLDRRNVLEWLEPSVAALRIFEVNSQDGSQSDTGVRLSWQLDARGRLTDDSTVSELALTGDTSLDIRFAQDSLLAGNFYRVRLVSLDGPITSSRASVDVDLVATEVDP